MRWLCTAALALGACKGGTKRDDAGAVVVAERARDAAVRDAEVADAASATPAQPARVEHIAYSFTDNRHAAHRFVSGDLAIDAGDIGFAKYTRFGVPALRWHLGKLVDGQRAAIADRLASLELPIAPGPASAATQRSPADIP